MGPTDTFESCAAQVPGLEEAWRTRVPPGTERCVVGILVADDWDPLEPECPELEIADAVMQAGGRPRLLFPGRGEAAEQMRGLDALVAPGGEDVDPSFYGRSRGPGMRSSRTDPTFDRFEIRCIRQAFREALPMLGFCRGQQIMNVAGGGTLVQDIPSERPTPVDHRPPGVDDPGGARIVAHDIRVRPGSRLAGLVGGKSPVNSLHHQCLAAMSPLLLPVAWASDGVVEAVQHKTRPWQSAVQFHPEALRHVDARYQGMFDRLVDDGAKFRAGLLRPDSSVLAG